MYDKTMPESFVTSGGGTPVVVLDLGYGGYGAVRALVPYGIPVIGFVTQEKKPEYKTRLCEQKICYRDESDLLEKLKSVASRCNRKPVLILTGDKYVNFVIENRVFIDEHFLIHLPSNPVIKLLLDKTLFSEYAEQNKILIPRTCSLSSTEDLEKIETQLNFPVILKPFLRTPRWIEANLAKTYRLATIDELRDVYLKISPVEPRLMAQEWIPGDDQNLFYCLMYFDAQSECLGSFTGFKIRQWPIGTGTACATAPIDDPYILERSVEIFRQLKYRGFGSIEYKKSELNGKYYVIEPTVGRTEQQGHVATLNGVNLPLRCYNALTHVDLVELPPSAKKIIYIEEPAEIASAFVHIRKKLIGVKDYFKSIQGPKAYRYFNWHDPVVFAGLVMKTMRFLLGKLTGEKKRKKGS